MVNVTIGEDGKPKLTLGGDETRETNKPNAEASFTEKLLRVRKELAGNQEQKRKDIVGQGGLTQVAVGGTQSAQNMTNQEAEDLDREIRGRLQPGQATNIQRGDKWYHVRHTPGKGLEYGQGTYPLRYQSNKPGAYQGDEEEYQNVPYWEK